MTGEVNYFHAIKMPHIICFLPMMVTGKVSLGALEF